MKNRIKNHLSTGISRSTLIISIQAFALIFTMNSLLSCKGNGTQQNTQAQDSTAAAHDTLAASRDSLQAQNNAIRLQVDELTTKTARLDSQIAKKDIEIASLKSKVSHLQKNNKAMAAELKKDKTLISSLKDELADKDKSYSDQLGVLENDKSNLIKERDALLDKYAKLKALGSVLHASNIRLEAVHMKHHGTKEKNTTRARRADALNITFDIDENRIAEDGTKKLYLVITDPSGNLLSAPSMGGSITTSLGSKINYSVLKEIALKQNTPVKDILVEWKQEMDYTKGTYSIAIYNEGYKIGSGNVELN